jgi:hypothetical protein
MYKVKKEYCGIEVGKKVNSKSKTTCERMVKEGFWEPLKKIEPKVKSRQNKVEPGLETRKNK